MVLSIIKCTTDPSYADMRPTTLEQPVDDILGEMLLFFIK